MSTDDQLVSLVQAAFAAWEESRDLLIISFDVEKAFDSVWREALLFKLKRLGVDGHFLMLMFHYCKGRTMRVRVGVTLSDLFPLFLGVPQGAVLSPILFLCFVYDLPMCIPRGVSSPQFADDTNLYLALPRAQCNARKRALDLAQLALDRLADWFSAWHLKLEPSKTKALVCTRESKTKALVGDISLRLYDHTLKFPQTPIRHLGAWLDVHLNFDHHTDVKIDLAKPRIQILKLISGASWGIPIATRLRFYTMWIRPVVETGSVALSQMYKTTALKYDNFQRQALRVCLGTKRASLQALEAITGTESMSIRRLKRWAALGSKLSRLRDCPLAARWSEYCKSPLQRIKWPRLSCQPIRKIHPSPFLLARGILSELQMTSQDKQPLPLPLALDPRPCLPPYWPSFGAAGTRSPGQAVAALLYTRSLIDSHISAGRAVVVSDGSVRPFPDPNGGGGGGVVLSWDGDSPADSASFFAGFLVDSVGVELTAILRALILFSASAKPPLCSGVTVLADCQQAVLLAQHPDPPAPDYWSLMNKIGEETRKIQSEGWDVIFDWIPGHVGFWMNEMADSLARQFLSDPSLPRFLLPPSLSTAKRFSSARLDQWVAQMWWDNYCDEHENTQSRLGRNQKLLSRPPIIIRILPPATSTRTRSVIYRLLLGAATTNRVMFHCHRSPTKDCSHCPGTRDSVEHRICDCPGHQDARLELSAVLEPLDLPLTMDTLLRLEGVSHAHLLRVTQAFIRFLECSHLTKLFLWDEPYQEELRAALGH